MITLEIDLNQNLIPDEILEWAAKATLDLSGMPDADLTLLLTGDPEIQALNRDYLGHDTPTDVLSFPADEPDPETGRRYLGDIIISVPRATEQASARGHALEAEVQLLIVHGVLHLLGHDHAEADEKARMWAAQAKALQTLGISPSIVSER